jgi:hypothetical protein
MLTSSLRALCVCVKVHFKSFLRAPYVDQGENVASKLQLDQIVMVSKSQST